MGNTFGFHKNITLFIQTQKPYYNSGSSIEGTIFLDVKDNCNFSALYIRIQGTQQCKWFQGSSKNRRKYTGYQKFYVVQHILHKFQGNFLAQGKYAFPFSIQLSDNIPGSFQSSEHDAKIQYNLIAYFANYNDNSSVTYQKGIIIRQPFRQQVAKYDGHVQTSSQSYTGHVKVNVEYDRNVALEGQDIQIFVNVDNTQGKNDIRRITTQLVQYTFVSSNANASRTYKNVVAKNIKSQTIKKGDVQKIDFLFKIPAVKYQTAIGTLVANYYRLQTMVETSKDLSIYAPIFILKQNFDIKGEAIKQNHSSQGYTQSNAICVRSGDYHFRKNKNLDIVNFKAEDLVLPTVYGSESPFA